MAKRIIKKSAKSSSITLSDAFIEFISERTVEGGVVSSTIDNYIKSVKYFMNYCEFNEETLVTEIDKNAILVWMARMREDGKKITTINHYIRDVRAFIYWCMDETRRYITPAFKINQIRGQEPTPKAYKKDDISILLEKPRRSDNFGEWRTWIIVNWVMATGNRAGTICEVKVGDVDLKRKVIALRHTKNKQYQSIPLSTELTHQLKEYMNLWLRGAEPDDYLFPNVSGEAMTYSALHSAFCRYCKGRGINQTNIHGLRHSFADLSLESGRNPFELQKMLGHSTLDMTRRYIRLHEEVPSPNFDKHTPLDNLKKPTSHKRKIQRTQ